MTETTVEACRNGHLWTEENTQRRTHRARGRETVIRQCRTCMRLARERRNAKTEEPATEPQSA